jgi:hypothetical protein
LPSIRFSFRARTRERGYALISAIVLAVLYFAVMQLLMIDSTRALKEAQRFRSKVISSTLAESAAELAAAQIINTVSRTVKADDGDGQMRGLLRHSSGSFEITGEGTSAGADPRKATVRVQGRIEGTKILVDYTSHSQ